MTQPEVSSTFSQSLFTLRFFHVIVSHIEEETSGTQYKANPFAFSCFHTNPSGSSTHSLSPLIAASGTVKRVAVAVAEPYTFFN